MNYLDDIEFLERVDLVPRRVQYAKITLLAFDTELPIKTIEGQITSGNLSVNGASAVRRTLTLSEIASVENGKVVALKPGIVVIYAKSEYNNQIFAYCEVTISQPVTGVSVSPNTYTLNNIGDLVQLEALVLPGDASNKNIKWTSSNESVCIVSNGTVVAVGEGTCVIIVTTEDGGYIATCTVTVTNATGISSIQNDGISFQIYDTNGAKRANFQRGVNIIRFADGTMKKILIK